MANSPEIPTVHVGRAKIHLTNVQLKEDVMLDEVHLEGENITLVPPPPQGGHGQVRTGETRFQATMSEPNINRMLEGNVPAEAPVKHLQAALFSGKIRITGQFVKLFGIGVPFTLDAVPVVENGIRIHFNLTPVGMAIPSSVMEVIEQQVNKELPLDLSKSPIPVWLDEIRCEPGRLTVLGKARIQFPPEPVRPGVSPFSAPSIPSTS